LIREHFDLSDTEVIELARSGIECIFGGEAEKTRLREMMWH
jgi:adenosine deaminase